MLESTSLYKDVLEWSYAPLMKGRSCSIMGLLHPQSQCLCQYINVLIKYLLAFFQTYAQFNYCMKAVDFSPAETNSYVLIKIQ